MNALAVANVCLRRVDGAGVLRVDALHRSHLFLQKAVADFQLPDALFQSPMLGIRRRLKRKGASTKARLGRHDQRLG